MTTSFKKIDHINIVVKDLENAKKFFLDLDFSIINQGKLQGDWIDNLTNLKNVEAEFVVLRLPDSQTNLELLKFWTPESESNPKTNILNQIGFRHIALAVENIEKVVAKLKTKDIQFLSEIQHYQPMNKKLCYFKGPEGIILELAEYK